MVNDPAQPESTQRSNPGGMSAPAAHPPERWLPAAAATLEVSGAPEKFWLVEFRIGLRSLPQLADHGFHDMAVVPGAFLIALALRAHRDLFQSDAGALRHVEFARPLLLSDDDIPLTLRVTPHGTDCAACEFFDAEAAAVRAAPAMQHCARMEMESAGAPGSVARARQTEAEVPLPAKFTTGAGDFYHGLRANGNQYGPGFQTITAVAQAGSQFVARIAESAGGDIASPALLDASAQLLSAFALEGGRTFLLKSIEHLVLHSTAASAPLTVVASREDSDAGNGSGLSGSVQFVDAGGALLCEMSGVRLEFFDRPASAEETRLCVASTFTAEPLEDSLRFWAAHFDRRVRIEFTPYNQVFQQLLDPAGAFHRNRDGINLIALRMEDWLRGDRRMLLSTSAARASEAFGSRPRHTLPNGVEIAHLNRYETEYVYREIFEDESYLRHGIGLPDDATVIDIGANIGLFSLFVMSRCRNPAIFACEPSPRVFDLLRANCTAYGETARVRVFNCGVAESKGSARFTFYEHSSVFSSFHPDEQEDRAAVEAVVRNVLQSELSDSSALRDGDVSELMAGRLHAESIECPLLSVSDLIRENGITRVHLLKIDAEKSELGILRGIEEVHWPLIEQIVMEVHDRSRAAVHAIERQLTARGFRCAVVEERLLERSGLFNIYATRGQAESAGRGHAADELRRKTGEFCAALDSFAVSTSAPLILAVTPRSASDPALDAAEDEVLTRAARHSQIRVIGSRQILSRHPVREFHDPHSQQLAHMPFTQEGYAALGTALSRAMFGIGAPPVKVIALDCDNTLWQGVCAEDGPAGVVLTPEFRWLQEFMLAQSRAGVLLALCSKNEESDVFAVLDQRGDMPLRREDFAAARINWESKPENLRSLAAQLGLGLDSFVFLDDNPIECAAVRASCPGVITLQLPPDHRRIPGFLGSIWIFDRAAATSEDRGRSEWYQANSEREHLRGTTPTLRDFLDGLQLSIVVGEAADDQLARVAQMTLRTNQFNLTSLRRSEGEIRGLLKSGAKCLTASVSDRFGDYGLVGAILFTTEANRLVADTFLLSCRALGKGVEHRMLSALAQRALDSGKSTVALPFQRSDRNQPARDFLSHLAPLPAEPDFTLELPASEFAELRYLPDDNAPKPQAEDPGTAATSTAHRSNGLDRSRLTKSLQKLGDDLTSVEAVVAAMHSAATRDEANADALAHGSPSDASSLESSLAAIWRRALGKSSVGFDENFFDAGGTSLKAVVVAAMIRRELRKNVSIVSIFECPTIRLLAARLGDSVEDPDAGDSTAAVAEARGKQRRNKLIRRRVA